MSPLEANFGDDLAKPFKYNTGTCPAGLEFASEIDEIQQMND
jgi:hypothetical protein